MLIILNLAFFTLTLDHGLTSIIILYRGTSVLRTTVITSQPFG